MNAIKILEDQHREVEQLFKAYAAVGEEQIVQQKRAIFLQIADALAAHASIEERLFYPAVKEVDEELLHESVREHLVVKRLLAELLDMEPDDEQFDVKIIALKAEVEHHVEEEQTELFPKVRKTFEAESLEQLGIEMENLFAEIMMEGEPSSHIPEELNQPAPI